MADLDKLILDIELRLTGLEKGLKDAENSSIATGKRIENTYKSINPTINNTLAKKSIAEIEQTAVKLRATLEKRIEANAPLGQLQNLQAALNKAEGAVSTFKRQAELPVEVPATDQISKWGMISSGIQSATMTVRQFFSDMKRLVGESIFKAAGFEEMSTYLKADTEQMELFRKVTKGTVDDPGLVALSNRAGDVNVKLNDQAVLFAIAKRAQEAYGGSITVAEGMEKAIMVTEGMTRGISKLGIESKVYTSLVNEMAKAHGGNIASLDGETQKEIRMQALLQLGRPIYEQMLNSEKSAIDQMESAGVTYQKAQRDLGAFVLQGLKPVIKAYDESPASLKTFLSSMVAIGGVVVGSIPMLVQLYTAKKMFTSATLLSAAATSTETVAVGANIAAGEVQIGMLGKLKAAMLTNPYTAIAVAALAVGTALYALNEVYGNTIENQEKAIASSKKFNETEQKRLSVLIDEKGKTHDVAVEYEGLYQQYIKTAKGTDAHTTAEKQLHEILTTQQKLYPDLITNTFDYAGGLDKIKEASGKAITDVRLLTGELNQQQRALVDIELANANLNLNKAANDVSFNSFAGGYDFKSLTDQIREGKKTLTEMIPVVQELYSKYAGWAAGTSGKDQAYNSEKATQLGNLLSAMQMKIDYFKMHNEGKGIDVTSIVKTTGDKGVESWTVMGKSADEINTQIKTLNDELGKLVPHTQPYADKLKEIAKLQDFLKTDAGKSNNTSLEQQLAADEKALNVKHKLEQDAIKDESERKLKAINDNYAEEIKKIDDKVKIAKAGDKEINMAAIAEEKNTAGGERQHAIDQLDEDNAKKELKLAEETAKQREEYLIKYYADKNSIDKTEQDKLISNYDLSLTDYKKYLDAQLDYYIETLKEKNRKIKEYNDNLQPGEDPLEEVDLGKVKTAGQKENQSQTNKYSEGKSSKDLSEWKQKNKLMAGIMDATDQSITSTLNSEWDTAWDKMFGTANSVLQKLGQSLFDNILSQLISMAVMFGLKAIFGAATGGVGFAAMAIPAATGGDFKGTNRGILKLANGGAGTVPSGYDRDTYLMALSSQEEFHVTTKDDALRGRGAGSGMSQGDVTRIVEAIATMDRNNIGKETSPTIIIKSNTNATQFTKETTLPAMANLNARGYKNDGKSDIK